MNQPLPPQSSFVEGIVKQHLGSAVSCVGTLILAVVVAFGNSRARDTHSTDVQSEQQQQLDRQKIEIETLQRQIQNDMATRREVDEVKQTVVRIEGKLDNLRDVEMKYHRP